MGWEDILKTKVGVSKRDITLINYIMQDGIPRTYERLMDDIYMSITATKKLPEGQREKLRQEGIPQFTKFGGTRHAIKSFFTNSPDYDIRKTGRDDLGREIFEFRYIGD